MFSSLDYARLHYKMQGTLSSTVCLFSKNDYVQVTVFKFIKYRRTIVFNRHVVGIVAKRLVVGIVVVMGGTVTIYGTCMDAQCLSGESNDSSLITDLDPDERVKNAMN